MPQLKDFRKTKTIALPSFPDSQVEIYDSLLVGDMIKTNIKADSDIRTAIEILPYMIKSWNFTDEKNNPIPITAENLGFLKADDLTVIFQTMADLASENKKK